MVFISGRMVLAHCIPDMLDTGVRNFRVYLGTNYITNGSDFLDLGIRKILSHHRFFIYYLILFFYF